MKFNPLILYHIKNLSKFGNDPYLDKREACNKCQDYLVLKGFKRVGSGCESVVYSKKGFEYVIKIVYDPFEHSGSKEPLNAFHFANSKSFKTRTIHIVIQEKVMPLDDWNNKPFPNAKIKAFRKFMVKKYGVGDLHSGNIGIIKGRLVVFDYTLDPDDGY